MFYKITTLRTENREEHEAQEVDMLINELHIVSIKKINIVISGDIIKGYWLRLSNGKKYKATSIPLDLLEIFDLPIFTTNPNNKNKSVDTMANTH